MSAKMQTNLERLRERVPDEMLKRRQQGGSNITYLSWYDACDLLDDRAPGWSCEIKEVGELAGKIFVRVALTIDGVTRENIGCEDEDMRGYGDVFSNSVGMALKRAAALFGLARHLYDKSDASRGGRAPQAPQRPPQQALRQQDPAQSNTPASDQQKQSILNLLEKQRPGDRRAQQALLKQHSGKESRDDLTQTEAVTLIKKLQGN